MFKRYCDCCGKEVHKKKMLNEKASTGLNTISHIKLHGSEIVVDIKIDMSKDTFKSVITDLCLDCAISAVKAAIKELEKINKPKKRKTKKAKKKRIILKKKTRKR